MDTASFERVADIKEKIQGAEGIRPGQQHLIFAGRQLDDGQTLGSCNLQREGTKHLVVREACSSWA